jgi:type I restriction enzyme S subunit
MSHYRPYPAYKDSGVEWLGRVPEHWKQHKLKYLARFSGGGTPSRDNLEYWGGSIPWVSPKDMKLEAIHSAEECITESGLCGSTTSLVPPGQVLLVVRSGILKHTIPVAINEVEVALNQDMKAIDFNSKLCASKFFLRWVQGFNDDLLQAWLKQGATVESIEQDFLANTIVPLPSVQEQQGIVRYVDREMTRIDGLVSKKSRFIELLREKRQALITHAVTKGLDPAAKMKDSGVEWLTKVPQHWNVVQLRHKAILESGHTPSRSHPEYWVDCDTPWFTLADVWQVRSGETKFVFETSEKISQVGLANSSARLLPAGSVFLSRTASVGFSGIMGTHMATSQDFAVWTCDDSLHNEFLYYVLRGMKGEFDRLMMGSTHKTIYMPDIEAIRIALPPIEEQKQIVAFLSTQFHELSKIIDKSELSLSLLKERRSALITAAVTGQIDLREAS